MAKRKQPEPEPSPPSASAGGEYTVLARRYRPQQFAEVIGQEPVAQALTNALESNRVAHAYLFTGARGVGKTSMARILAKALNCIRGPTATPCDVCDACLSITSGEDVDVLEIDGASNRGIDEVRGIRQNVQYSPARTRYKVYIIDEVHMLTPAAFNALLKTLEEPPPRVKFIFATTEVQKIPVTILSRCQRFDFAGISAPRIVEHLRQVLAAEGVEADDEALEMIARRAGGSMRDAQSLLDQVLAFSGGATGGRLTSDQVHQLLGTAHGDRVAALAVAVLGRDAKQALDLLGQAAEAGVQLGELLDQLISYWRDLMVANCAGKEASDLSVAARDRDALLQQAAAVSLDTVLAGLDILAATKARLRGSSHGRILLEMALVRLARLEDLVALSQLVQRLNGTASSVRPASPPAANASAAPVRLARSTPSASRPPEAEKKNPPAPAELMPTSLTVEALPAVWPEVLAQVGNFAASHLRVAGLPAICGPKTLVLSFGSGYNQQHEFSQRPQTLARIEEALRKITGTAWSLRVESVSNDAAASRAPAAESDPSPSRYRRQLAEALQAPLVKRAVEVLGAQVVRHDDDFGAAPAEAGERPEPEREGA